MKALSKLKAEEGIWMTDVPVPELGHNDLLIKIRKTAICGTDVHIYNWDEWSQKTIPVPMVVGHEYVGEVVGIGQEVKECGAQIIRGGAYKPRTSPYAFQGLGSEGIQDMVHAREKTGLPIVSELMSIDKLDEFVENVDLIQIGAKIFRILVF